MIWHWFLHYTGSTSESGPWYGFWSGFGSDLSEITLVGLAAGLWHKHNCHTKGCWRLGRQQVAGTTFVVCRRHHPDGKPTQESILAAHRAHSQEVSR